MSADCTLKIDKAKNELGYQPLISVQQGLEKMKQL
jgi:nucleoside-diphosphate-sugar epimerase